MKVMPLDNNNNSITRMNMMKLTSIVFIVTISIILNLTNVVISIAASPETKAFSFSSIKKITPDNVDVVMENMTKQLHLFMPNAQGKINKKELKELQRVSILVSEYWTKSPGTKPYNPNNKSKPVTKEEFYAEQKRMSKKKKHHLISIWKNRYGEVIEITLGGHIYFRKGKHVYWESRGDKIVLFDDSSSERHKTMRVTYNKNTDKITVYGAKYHDPIFYRYDEARKKRDVIAKAEKRKKDRIIIKRSMEQDAKREIIDKKSNARFYRTLTCKNCDLTTLKDHIFDCRWCDAEGSNFSKKDKLWSRYDFKWANLKKANFSKTSVRDTSFYKADLKGANFSGARIGMTNFAYANLENANFRNAQIGESLFNGANLKNADFTGATIVRADFSFSNINEKTLKSAKLDDVKIKATNIDKQMLGVWKMNSNNAYKDVYYYEFFEDGSFILTKGTVKRLTASDSRYRKFKEQRFYSVRKGAFEKMTSSSGFRDSNRNSKEIPTVSGNALTFTNGSNSPAKIYTRVQDRELTDYRRFRNTKFALNSAYYWNTDVIEKLSADGVNYATLHSIYEDNFFDHLFQSYISSGVQDDRHIRYIYKFLVRDNSEFLSGSNYEKMLVNAMNYNHIETLDFLLSISKSKMDMQYALVAYKSRVNEASQNKKVVELVDKRISEL